MNKGYKKKYNRIRDPPHVLGLDSFSYGFNQGFRMQEMNASLIEIITLLAVFN